MVDSNDSFIGVYQKKMFSKVKQYAIKNYQVWKYCLLYEFYWDLAYSADANVYLQPILEGLRNNRTPSEITTKVSSDNKCEQGLEKRSADNIERIAFAIQTTLDIFNVIDDIEPDIENDIKIEFGQITKATRLKIMETIRKQFYINDNPGSLNDSIINHPPN
ncbi:unnamed protein product, partial [Didymodactylos carnosus]